METAAVRARAAELPRDPGVYQFRNGETALYIGKAVDLRSRVRSYADPRSPRIKQMVRASEEIEIAVTDSETQALLLEANLIKRHGPRYNVRLTDDKSYPLVQLTDHDFPRIEATRDPDEAATVWGPFTDKGRVDTVIKALRETFGLRGCSDHKFASRDRPCLDYDIGLCSAPCTGEISQAGYEEAAASTSQFFDGATGVLAEPLRRDMAVASEEHAYERAAHLRDQLDAVEAFHGGGGDAVQSPDERQTRDVLGAVVEGDSAIVARLHSDGGKLVERDRHSLDCPDDATAAGVLAAFIPQYYADRPLPDALVLSDQPDDDELAAWLDAEGVAVSAPGAGRSGRLVDLALKNARRGWDDGVAALAESLELDAARRIEGFDVSHAAGKATVGSNVVFVQGAPKKADYRRKRLDGGNDDVANMRSLLRWRATRAIEGRDDRPDPDLLLIDGGPTQLNAALEALSSVGWERPVVALAKGEELVVTPDGRHAWPDDASHLHLLQLVRDEAHRFAVSYHRTVRDDVGTALDDVPGVGPQLRRRLLRRFGSVDGVRAASVGELRAVEGVGEHTATSINSHLGDATT